MKHLITLLLIILTLNGYSQSKSEINEYYKEICGNWEFNGKKKPKRYKKDVKIFVRGLTNDSLEMELHSIVKELNHLINSLEISIVTDSSESNIYMYFGGAKDFVNSINEPQYMKDWRLSMTEDSWGCAWVKEGDNHIINSKVFIDTERNDSLVRLKHLLREELTQALGFPNDSYKYSNSIFQQKWTEVTEYSKIDKEIIKLHYNNTPQL